MGLLAFLFGVFSYLVGVSALVGWIVTMLGIMPFQEGPIQYGGGLVSFAVALGLTLLFALQHTIMARKAFKDKVEKFLPASCERSLFVLLTGLILWAAIVFWPADATVIWNVENPMVAKGLVGFALFGWAYLFIASFAINHFELFGLQQTFNHFRGKSNVPVPFKERLMYKFDRHPIMTGAIIGMWSVPTMTVSHLMFSGLFTMYIVFGVSIEERDLIRQWGEGYKGYKKRVKSIVPTFGMK